MRKIAVCLIVLGALITLPLGALASVSATPNRKLALRTGPGSRYVELRSMPQDTRLLAFEYEDSSAATWVLIEYERNGQVERAYTGVQRMTVHGQIPYAVHLNEGRTLASDAVVYAAPTSNAACRTTLFAGDYVTLLARERGYGFIEFYDVQRDANSRGYVLLETIMGNSPRTDVLDPDGWDGQEWHFEADPSLGRPPLYGVSATPTQDLALRTGPNTAYVWFDMMPRSTPIVAYEYEEGNSVTWVLVEFTYDGLRCRGYTGLKRMWVNGNIPWADHLYRYETLRQGCVVLAAPGEDACYRGWLEAGSGVTLLEYDGDYAFVEFYDASQQASSRGYVPAWVLQ